MRHITKSIYNSVVRVCGSKDFASWRLDIMQPAEIEDGVYSPPVAITLYTEHAIKTLRDALTEALED